MTIIDWWHAFLNVLAGLFIGTLAVAIWFIVFIGGFHLLSEWNFKRWKRKRDAEREARPR